MSARAFPLARPIFLLVIASVLVATAVSFVVTFSGPPPFEPPRSLFAIGRALQGRAAPFDRGGLPSRIAPGLSNEPKGLSRPFRRGPAPLRRVASLTTPSARDGEQADAATVARLASVLQVQRADLRAFTQPGRSEGDALSGHWTVGWREGARWWIVQSQEPPLLTRWHVRTLLALLAAILILSLPAWWITRALTRPLQRLASAADQAGTGAPLPALPGGSREVQDLAHAVSTMHARLAGHAEARTAMLAGIAHDLGTPLARLAFRIESLPEDARVRAAADIEEMRAMIGATLAFTRDEGGTGSMVRLDLGSLLDSLIDDMSDTGNLVSSAGGPRAIVRGDPSALRRLFTNLIENAMLYGNQASVRWSVSDALVSVTVDDAGPGIDPGQAERLFQPFVRGDPSRNRATGGTGLGLAIVRSIATAHGGAATLENIEAGARARVVLPLSS